MEEEIEKYIPNGYIDIGVLPDEVVYNMNLDNNIVLIEASFAEEIDKGSIGQFLRKADIDYECLGINMLSSVIEYPQQVREGGEDTLLLIKSFSGYAEYGKTITPYCLALYIVLMIDEKGQVFWKCINVETHYNFYRKDTILWESNRD